MGTKMPTRHGPLLVLGAGMIIALHRNDYSIARCGTKTRLARAQSCDFSPKSDFLTGTLLTALALAPRFDQLDVLRFLGPLL